MGMLRCLLDPSVGFIFTGHESMQCSFAQSAGSPQAYEGAINMVGLDVIRTAAGGAFEWAVFASTTGTPADALAGEYVGASGDLGSSLVFQPMSSSCGAVGRSSIATPAAIDTLLYVAIFAPRAITRSKP